MTPLPCFFNKKDTWMGRKQPEKGGNPQEDTWMGRKQPKEGGNEE